MSTDTYEGLPARSDGTTLVVTGRSGLDTTYAWAGPATAHHATVTEVWQGHPYGVEHRVEILVYDAENKLLGRHAFEEWH